MNPFEMWKIMKYNAFNESVVPFQVIKETEEC